MGIIPTMSFAPLQDLGGMLTWVGWGGVGWGGVGVIPTMSLAPIYT